MSVSCWFPAQIPGCTTVENETTRRIVVSNEIVAVEEFMKEKEIGY
jgi:hypothetical protein